MLHKDFSLEQNFNELRQASYLKITRIFLILSSLIYWKWGCISTEILQYSNEALWVRPLGILPSILIFIFTFKSKFVVKHLSKFVWLAVTWIFLNYIYFIIYQNQGHISSVIGLFIVLFGTAMFLRNNKELFFNSIIVIPSVAIVFNDLNVHLVDEKMVLLAMITNYLLIAIFLYGKNYFIKKTSESYSNLKILLDSGNPTILTYENNLVYHNNNFLIDFNISLCQAKDLNFEKVYDHKKSSINGHYVKIDRKEIKMNGKKLFLYIFKDITFELKDQAKDRKVAQMNNMREITGTVAHEINNPLMIIQMASESLSFAESEEEKNELVERIDDTIERMKRTILNLKVLAKDVSKETKSDFFIEAAIEELLDIVKFKLEQFNISYEIKSNIKNSVCLRKYHLFQVLLNLVNNSIDSLSDMKRKDKKIIIEVIQVGDEIFFTVSDNGKGVESKDKEKIFKPFFSKKQIGTGMGLTIAQDLLNDIGGSLRLKESSPDKTVFLFSVKIDN